ncbi:MAG: S41 family peptidase [Myxococcota bacterium]
MLLLASALFTAQAGLSERSYERAVDLVEGLYLYPDDVDAHAMLRESADQLSDSLHWLVVENQGNAVNLRHGDGRLIGSVSVASLDTLPAALMALEQLVVNAGVDIDPEIDVRLTILKGMTRALDRYSRVLSGDGLDRFDVRLKGTLVGVGLTISLIDEQMVVTHVTPGGPAALGGVREGDVIARIDGRSTVNMPTSEATRKIRGEEGTNVVFTLLRDGKELVLPLTRTEIVVPNVESRILEGNVGLVRITHVSQRTVENLLSELDGLQKQGALDHGLVLDLRGNTGGSMKESARAVDEFVDSGMLLRTAGHDGGRVRNLQARMDAEEGGALLDLPVVVLMDDRTASGAEILAGSLLELDRAALVGTRSYGKGTVQKIYPLDEDARLKLTVAQYLLEHDRVIADVGIVPDVVVGEISLDSYGVHYEGWDTERLRTKADDIVPWVREGFSWRSEDVPSPNVVEEIARLAILEANSPRREDLVRAVKKHAEVVKAAQDTHLDEAFAAKGIDWSPAEEPATRLPPLRVKVTSEEDPTRPDVLRVVAELENRGDVPLYRAAVELKSEFAGWDGLVLPIGKVVPGAAVTGEVYVPLHAGVNPREDRVTVLVRGHGVGPTRVTEASLQAKSTPEPRLEGHVKLVASGAEHRAVVVLSNRSNVDVDGLEVHFGYPGDVDVELLDRASRIGTLPGGESRTVELGVHVGPGAPAVLPMRLEVETERYGTLETWPLELPMDGREVVLDPPRITPLGHPANAPAGPFTFGVRVDDDRRLDHVVVYQNGRKVGWAAGAPKRVELRAEVELEPGVNRMLVVTRDDQGLEEREQFVIRGVASDASVDAP